MDLLKTILIGLVCPFLLPAIIEDKEGDEYD